MKKLIAVFTLIAFVTFSILTPPAHASVKDHSLFKTEVVAKAHAVQFNADHSLKSFVAIQSQSAVKFVVRISANRQFYFIAKARNGKIIGTSETYKTRAGCYKGIAAWRKLHNAKVTDHTKQLDVIL